MTHKKKKSIIFPGGSKYTGELKDGAMHGQGTYINANGDIYVGSFQDDTFEGYGELNLSDGTNSLEDIANRSNLPLKLIENAANILIEKHLLK